MSDPSPAGWPEQLTQSRTRWGVEIGGLQLAVTRTREERRRGDGVTRSARGPWGIAIGAFASLSALALLVVGAGAARPESQARYSVVVPVPEVAAPAVRRVAPATPRPTVGVVAAKPVMTLDKAFGSADEPYVARALASGAFQEWEDAAGQRRFLTAGPARIAGGRACRNLALLIRLPDGGSRVRSAERCIAAPLIEDMPDAPPAPSDRADE